MFEVQAAVYGDDDALELTLKPAAPGGCRVLGSVRCPRVRPGETANFTVTAGSAGPAGEAFTLAYAAGGASRTVAILLRSGPQR